MRAWSTPPARVRAARVRSWSRAEPRTLTHTVAWARSRVVCTPVTVTNPRPGSFSSWIPSDSTCFTASSTRRIRPPPRPGEPRLVIEAHHRALDRERLESLSRQPAFAIVEQTDGLADLPDRSPPGARRGPCARRDCAEARLRRRRLDRVRDGSLPGRLPARLVDQRLRRRQPAHLSGRGDDRGDATRRHAPLRRRGQSRHE